jgi:hypothetical protein
MVQTMNNERPAAAPGVSALACMYCAVPLRNFADVQMVNVNGTKTPACRDTVACSERKAAFQRRQRNQGGE